MAERGWDTHPGSILSLQGLHCSEYEEKVPACGW